MLKIPQWTETDQTVRKQQGQLSKWLQYKEDSLIYQVHLLFTRQWAWKETENLRKTHHGRIWDHWWFDVKINRNYAIKGSYADFCDKIGQYGNKRVVEATAMALQHAILLLGTVQWDWAGVGICAGWKKCLAVKIEWMESKWTIKIGLVGRCATDFLAPWMIGRFTVVFP